MLRRLNGLRPFKLSCLSATERRSTAAGRATVVCGFFAYKKILGRIETRTSDKKYLGCDQFETSPEAIDQELRTAFCERRQTDRLKRNYTIDKILKINVGSISYQLGKRNYLKVCN